MTIEPPTAPPLVQKEKRSSARSRPIRLGTGGAVSLENINRISGRRRSRLVVLAGPVASGKTTIVASMYEAFHGGPFADHLFGGSSTLVALEQRCHEGRLTSGLEIPTTGRTLRTQTGDLVHLTVSPQSAPALGDIFINDVTGELFDAVVRRPAAAGAMAVLSKADRIAITLDGQLLVDPERRDFAAYQSEMLARAIAEYGGLKLEARVDVVVTKLDKVMEHGDGSGKAREAALGVTAAVPEPYRGDIFLTCARSEVVGGVPSGKGIDDLFKVWIGGRPERLLSVTREPRRRRAEKDESKHGSA
jgi:hypothetical protein